MIHLVFRGREEAADIKAYGVYKGKGDGQRRWTSVPALREGGTGDGLDTCRCWRLFFSSDILKKKENKRTWCQGGWTWTYVCLL